MSEQNAAIDVIGDNARSQLLSFVERVERMDEEIEGMQDDRKEIFAEAKGQGFDAKILRKVIARRKKNQAALAEEEAIFDLYWAAVHGTGE